MRVVSRYALGVKVIDLEPGDKVVSIVRQSGVQEEAQAENGEPQ